MTSYLTVDEVAQRLTISKSTIYRMVAQAEMPPPVRMGGSARWRDDTLTEFEEERATAAKWAAYSKVMSGETSNGALTRAMADLNLTDADVAIHREILDEHKRLAAEIPVLEKAFADVPDAGHPGILPGGEHSLHRDAYLQAADDVRQGKYQLAALEDFCPGLFNKPIRLNPNAQHSLPVELRNRLHKLDEKRAREAAERARREAHEERKQKLQEARATADDPKVQEEFYR